MKTIHIFQPFFQRLLHIFERPGYLPAEQQALDVPLLKDVPDVLGDDAANLTERVKGEGLARTRTLTDIGNIQTRLLTAALLTVDTKEATAGDIVLKDTLAVRKGGRSSQGDRPIGIALDLAALRKGEAKTSAKGDHRSIVIALGIAFPQLTRDNGVRVVTEDYGKRGRHSGDAIDELPQVDALDVTELVLHQRITLVIVKGAGEVPWQCRTW